MNIFFSGTFFNKNTQDLYFRLQLQKQQLQHQWQPYVWRKYVHGQNGMTAHSLKTKRTVEIMKHLKISEIKATMCVKTEMVFNAEPKHTQIQKYTILTKQYNVIKPED